MNPTTGSPAARVDRLDGRSTEELLADVADRRALRRRLEVEEFGDIVAWADTHVVETVEGAATITDSRLDTGVPIAGPGAPLVSEFGLMELIAFLGLSPDGGRDYVGKVIETAWRLPRIYAAVLAGTCPVFKALRVAELTRPMNREAAGYVDAQLAFAVGGCTWAQVERLVSEAITRFDPALAEERRQQASDARRFDIHLDQAGPDGTVPAAGLMDAADAVDLDTAIGRRAQVLGACGHEGSLDVRRSIAAGEIARTDLQLDLEVCDPETGEITRTVPGRKVELHVHLSDAAVNALSVNALSSVVNNRTDSSNRDHSDADAGDSDRSDSDPRDREGETGSSEGLPVEAAVGRLGNTQTPVSPLQIRDWVTTPDSTVIVRPVIDLADHIPVDSYEIPDRVKTQVRLRDHRCRYPGCHKRAEACDLDHATPHADGGPTCACNLVPLCRRHHRAKTFSRWRYVIIEPGSYLWLSPEGGHILVDHRGTRPLDPPRRLDPDPDPPEWADPGWGEPHWTDTTDPGWADPPPAATEPDRSDGRRRRRGPAGDQLDLLTAPPPE